MGQIKRVPLGGQVLIFGGGLGYNIAKMRRKIGLNPADIYLSLRQTDQTVARKGLVLTFPSTPTYPMNRCYEVLFMHLLLLPAVRPTPARNDSFVRTTLRSRSVIKEQD